MTRSQAVPGDPVSAAIAAVGAPAAPVERRLNGNIRLSTGRVVGVNIPDDLTDTELMDLVGQIATQIRVAARKPKGPASRLLIPR